MGRDGPTFPVYLLPSFRMPFRRRSTVSSDASQSSVASSLHSSAAGDNVSVLSPSPPPPPLSSSPLSSSVVTSPGTSPPPPPASFPDFYFRKASFTARQVDELTRRSSYFSATSGSDHPDQQQQQLSPSPAQRRLARAASDTLRCGTCSTDLAFASQIVSKGFTGRYGRAYLVSPPPAVPQTLFEKEVHGRNARDRPDLANVRIGKPEHRQLVTGAHVVADIGCAVCSAKLGWKYVDAKEASQKYKVGKFILETQRVVSFRSWEDVERRPGEWGVPEAEGLEALEGDEEAEMVEFDSEDEDQCEDVFAGVWDARAVADRRVRR